MIVAQSFPQHGMPWLCLSFIGGLLLHTLKSASTAVRNNAFSDRKSYFKKYWDVVFVRSILEFVGFLGWANYPTLLTTLLDKFGVSFSLELPLSPITSFALGFVADSLLDLVVGRIPFLKKEVPMIEQEVVKSKSVGTALDGSMKVTEEVEKKVTRERVDQGGRP